MVFTRKHSLPFHDGLVPLVLVVGGPNISKPGTCYYSSGVLRLSTHKLRRGSRWSQDGSLATVALWHPRLPNSICIRHSLGSNSIGRPQTVVPRAFSPEQNQLAQHPQKAHPAAVEQQSSKCQSGMLFEDLGWAEPHFSCAYLAPEAISVRLRSRKKINQDGKICNYDSIHCKCIMTLTNVHSQSNGFVDERCV